MLLFDLRRKALPSLLLLFASAVVLVGVATPAEAQDPQQEPPGAAGDTLSGQLDRPARVYLDCQLCDESYLRRNLTFVDYVRDRRQADVHLLVTFQRTGGGGLSYRLEFIGQGPFEGARFELTYNADPTQTNDERRKGLAKRIRIGLGPFAEQTPVGGQLALNYEGASEEEETTRSPEEDPWNKWVFEIGGSGRFGVQEQSQRYDFRADLEANRITQAWKMEFGAQTDFELDVFQPQGREEVRSSSRDNAFNAEVVKSLGPHWGAGISERTFSRTSTNKALAIRTEAALEYNVFPYRMSDQKSLTFTYRIGPEYNKYQEETIFGRRTQSLGRQSLEVSLDLDRPWGSIRSSLEGSHYFHDLTKNRLRFNNSVRLQIFEGLSLRAYVLSELIQDQLFLPRSRASEEEVLLRRRELATDFQIRGSVGLSYTFGSIYNNVVNPRL